LSCTAGSDGDRARGASALIGGDEEEIMWSMARTGQGPKDPHVSPLYSYKGYKPGFDFRLWRHVDWFAGTDVSVKLAACVFTTAEQYIACHRF